MLWLTHSGHLISTSSDEISNRRVDFGISCRHLVNRPNRVLGEIPKTLYEEVIASLCVRTPTPLELFHKILRLLTASRPNVNVFKRLLLRRRITFFNVNVS